MSYPDLSEKTMIDAMHAYRIGYVAPFIRTVLPEIKSDKPYAIIECHGVLYVLANKNEPVVVFVRDNEAIKSGKVPGVEDEDLLREHDLEGTFNKDYDLVVGPSKKTAYDLLKDVVLTPSRIRVVGISS